MALPDLSLPVDVLGDADIRSPGGVDLKLAASGSEIIVVAGTISDLVRLWRGSPRRENRSGLSTRLHHLSRAAGISFSLRVRSRPVAKLGPESTGTWVSRLMRLGPVDVRLRDALAALFVNRLGTR